MNRRRYLSGVGAALATLLGVAAVGDATRADVAAERGLHRPRGTPVSTRVIRDDAAHRSERDAVRDGDGTHPFAAWLRRTAFEHAAETVVPVGVEETEAQYL